MVGSLLLIQKLNMLHFKMLNNNTSNTNNSTNSTSNNSTNNTINILPSSYDITICSINIYYNSVVVVVEIVVYIPF